MSKAKNKTILIIVSGGVVQHVVNIPTGYEYGVVDYDNLAADPSEFNALNTDSQAYVLKHDPEFLTRNKRFLVAL